MSSSKWSGWEVCETHDALRRGADLKVSRMVREEKEVDGEGGERTVVLETKFYVCLDGCPFLQPKPYDGKYGADPVRRSELPDAPPLPKREVASSVDPDDDEDETELRPAQLPPGKVNGSP